MKTRWKVAGCTAAVFLALTGIEASVADGGWKKEHRRHHGRFGPGPFERLDVDANGRINQAELDEARRGKMKEFDGDGDGRLSLSEYEALWMERMRRRMVDSFQRLDDDGDGAVTETEFLEPFSYMVARLDRNDDGEVTPDEMRRRGERGNKHRHRGEHRKGEKRRDN